MIVRGTTARTVKDQTSVSMDDIRLHVKTVRAPVSVSMIGKGTAVRTAGALISAKHVSRLL